MDNTAAVERPSDKYKGCTAVQLVHIMSSIAHELDDINERKSSLQKELDAIRKYALPDTMEEEGITNMAVTGIGRISLRSDVYATIKAVNKDNAFDWLRGTGHGGIVKESVHAGTLKALMKTLIKEGGDLPPDELIQVTPYSMAVLTRSRQ